MNAIIVNPSHNSPRQLPFPTFKDNKRLELEFKLLKKTKQALYQCQIKLKRLFDIIGAIIGLIILSPLFLLVIGAIKITSPGPLFYKSKRIGKNQKPFNMYKFRTMVNGADTLREKLRKEHGQNGQLFKIKNDQRITPIGNFLRKTSLDEFPQLINVLKGEMSLVGPRPFSADNCQYFEEPFTLRFVATPGMTGAWQVNGRSDSTIEQAATHDLDYVINWHFMTDIKILLKTIPAVLNKSGAY